MTAKLCNAGSAVAKPDASVASIKAGRLAHAPPRLDKVHWTPPITTSPRECIAILDAVVSTGNSLHSAIESFNLAREAAEALNPRRGAPGVAATVEDALLGRSQVFDVAMLVGTAICRKFDSRYLSTCLILILPC